MFDTYHGIVTPCFFMDDVGNHFIRLNRPGPLVGGWVSTKPVSAW